MILLGDKFDLLFCKLTFTDEMELFLINTCDWLIVGVSNHAVIDL